MHGLLLIHLPAEAGIAEVEAELGARMNRFMGSEEHARLLEAGPPSMERNERMSEIHIHLGQKGRRKG